MAERCSTVLHQGGHSVFGFPSGDGHHAVADGCAYATDEAGMCNISAAILRDVMLNAPGVALLPEDARAGRSRVGIGPVLSERCDDPGGIAPVPRIKVALCNVRRERG
jgi:hypothetical protein